MPRLTRFGHGFSLPGAPVHKRLAAGRRLSQPPALPPPAPRATVAA